MKVDQDTVRHIARLARIRVTDEEAKALEGELTAILDWVEQLGEVETDGVEPMTSAVEMSLHLRDDAVTAGGTPEAVVGNAPVRHEHYFAVPKVVE